MVHSYSLYTLIGEPGFYNAVNAGSFLVLASIYYRGELVSVMLCSVGSCSAQ
jgi:hypothetical protein